MLIGLMQTLFHLSIVFLCFVWNRIDCIFVRKHKIVCEWQNCKTTLTISLNQANAYFSVTHALSNTHTHTTTVSFLSLSHAHTLTHPPPGGEKRMGNQKPWRLEADYKWQGVFLRLPLHISVVRR